MNLFNIFKGRDLTLRTIAYILAVIFFFSSWIILGPDRAYIGATVAKGALVLLGTDLTGNPIRSGITFFFVFIFIGIGSFLSSFNLYLGFFINLIIIFILAYKFSSNIKQIIWRPFVLGYLYLLTEPGTLKMLPSRLLTLGLGAFFVLLTQFIVNKNKSKNSQNSAVTTIIDEISRKINSLLIGEKVKGKKEIVTSSVDKIISSIYKKRIDPLFITKKDNIILNFTLYAERLNYLLKEIKVDLKNPFEKDFLTDLNNLMKSISKVIIKENSNEELLSLLEEFYNKYKDLTIDKHYTYDILQNIEMLKLSIFTETNYQYKKTDILFNRKLKKEITTAWRFNFSRDSIRFTFAVRISLLLSISFFLVHFFHIEKGTWIVFTIFAVLDPLFEDSKKRFSKRFKGTLLGLLIFFLVYMLIDNTLIEGLIFIGMYYIYVINKDFGIKTMCTTSVSLGLFSIVSRTPYKAISYRFSFVVLGIIIGYLANKYLLPYDSTRARKRITSLYYELNKEILSFTLKNPINDYFFRILSEKMFLSKLYESKLISFKNDLMKEFIHNQRILNNTIFFLFFSIKDNKEKTKIINKFISEINNINIKEFDKKYFEEKFFTLKSNEEKLIFTNLHRILIREEKSKALMEELSKHNHIEQINSL